MVNSKVSRQWLWDRYAMKALNVHGGGDEFESISSRFGLRGQYAPCILSGSGMAMVMGREEAT
jgi:hypothetical protein